MIELLSPVGDFECLKAAIQNGADAVYFGANLFSARAFATNFDNENLKKVINYAKIRGVKTHLTLNTLIKQEVIYTIYFLDILPPHPYFFFFVPAVGDIGFGLLLAIITYYSSY